MVHNSGSPHLEPGILSEVQSLVHSKKSHFLLRGVPMVLLVLLLLDGSSVSLNVDKTDCLKIETRYGLVSVPYSDVRECSFGVHVDDEAKYRDLCKALGSDDFKARLSAMKTLDKDKRGAYRYLLEVKEDKNLEVANRVRQLLAAHTEKYQLFDKVSLQDGSQIVGNITNKVVKGRSRSIGDLSIAVHQSVSAKCRMGSTTLTLYPDKAWHKVGYILDGRITISAEGQVDLFPQTPSQWMAGPGGFVGGAMKDGYPGGALLGRVNGRVFMVGRSFVAENAPCGDLELSINGSTWEAPNMDGEYTVTLE